MKRYRVKVNGKVYEVEVEAVEEVPASMEPKKEKEIVSEGKNEILAPLAGKVIDVKVKVGDRIEKGQTVAIIEAMKLENEIQSAFRGTVAKVMIQNGDEVKNKDVLVVLE